jgi:hypothetical protein
MATAVVVVLIVAGILIHVLGASTSNGLVSFVDDAARWLTQPFHGIFNPSGADARIAVNWGLAAVVYAIAGNVIARLLARSAVGGRSRGFRRPWRRAAT